MTQSKHVRTTSRAAGARERLLLLARLPLSVRILVQGYSMSPSFHDGDRLLVERLGLRLHCLHRGDVVVAREPSPSDLTAVKRVVGLPGERVRVEKGRAFVDGRALEEPYVAAWDPAGERDGEWALRDGEYFLLGDERLLSVDSRAYGPIARRRLLGVAWCRYWPPERRGLLK